MILIVENESYHDYRYRILRLLDERSARRRPKNARTEYSGFELVVGFPRGAEAWYSWGAINRAVRDDVPYPGRLAYKVGEHREELARWAYAATRKLHRGPVAGLDLTPLPDVWHDTPFDVALELLARGMRDGVYQVPDMQITPLSAKDRRRMTRGVPTQARANPTATAQLTYTPSEFSSTLVLELPPRRGEAVDYILYVSELTRRVIFERKLWDKRGERMRGIVQVMGFVDARGTVSWEQGDHWLLEELGGVFDQLWQWRAEGLRAGTYTVPWETG